MNKEAALSFQDSGEFLNWWFQEQRLRGQAERTLSGYYANYRGNFDGYLKDAWADRHFELDECLASFKGTGEVRILDLGCGTGSVALYLASRLEGKARVLGIDINEERLFCATERLSVLQAEIRKDLGCEFRSANVFDLSPDEKFDLIYLEETFHHLEPRMKAVKKISESLHENGFLIISEINAFNPFMQALLLKRRGLRTIVKKTDSRGHTLLYGNERIIPSTALAGLFSSSGLRHIGTRYFRLFNSSFTGLYGRQWELMALEKKIIRLGILKYLLAIHYNAVFTKTS